MLLSYGDGGSYVVLADNVPDGIDKLIELRKQNPSGAAAAAAAGRGGRPPTDQPTATPSPATSPSEAAPGGTDLDAAAAKVEAAIAEVREAQTSGDFARYGQALEALDKAMTEFQEAQRRRARPAGLRRRRLTRQVRRAAGDVRPRPAPDPVVLRSVTPCASVTAATRGGAAR